MTFKEYLSTRENLINEDELDFKTDNEINEIITALKKIKEDKNINDQTIINLMNNATSGNAVRFDYGKIDDLLKNNKKINDLSFILLIKILQLSKTTSKYIFVKDLDKFKDGYTDILSSDTLKKIRVLSFKEDSNEILNNARKYLKEIETGVNTTDSDDTETATIKLFNAIVRDLNNIKKNTADNNRIITKPQGEEEEEETIEKPKDETVEEPHKENTVEKQEPTQISDPNQVGNVSTSIVDSWNIEKPKEKTLDVYIETINKYRQEAANRLQKILNSTVNRRNKERAQEVKRNEENTAAERKRYEETKLQEALLIAQKYNKTINEAITSKLKFTDKGDEVRDKKLEKEILDKYDVNDGIIGEIIEKYNNKVRKLFATYNKAGFRFENVNSKLTTIFVDLEYELNKTLKQVKKDAAPSLHQRYKDEKEYWRQAEENYKKTNEKERVKQNHIDNTEDAKFNREYNSLIEKLNNVNSEDDVYRIFKFVFIEAVNNAKDKAELLSVFTKEANFYHTKPGMKDFSNAIQEKTIQGAMNRVIKKSTQIFEKDYGTKGNILEKLREDLREKFSTALKEKAEFTNTVKTIQTKLDEAIKTYEKEKETKFSLTGIQSSDGRLSLNGTGVDDIALRQVLASRKAKIVSNTETEIIFMTARQQYNSFTAKDQEAQAAEQQQNAENRAKENQLDAENQVRQAGQNNENAISPKGNIFSRMFNRNKPTNNVQPTDNNTSTANNGQATVTTAATDGLPIGYQRKKINKVMKRKLGL
jgi:hypothetical protein